MDHYFTWTQSVKFIPPALYLSRWLNLRDNETVAPQTVFVLLLSKQPENRSVIRKNSKVSGEYWKKLAHSEKAKWRHCCRRQVSSSYLRVFSYHRFSYVDRVLQVQELVASRYTPVKNDPIDVCLARWINGLMPAVPFFRLGPSVYVFGKRQVSCRVTNDKPVEV